MSSFGRLLAGPVIDQPREPFYNRKASRRDLLNAPDARLGQTRVTTRERRLNSVLKNPGRSTDAQQVFLTLGLRFDEMDLPPFDLEGGDRRLDIVALLSWGQGGAQFRAEVDWRNGVQVSVPASQVEVSALYEDVDINTFLGCTVSAGYCWGASGNRVLPTRTFPKLDLEAGAVAIVPVPPFANAFTVYQVGGDVTATLLGGPDVTDRVFGTIDPTILGSAAILGGEGVKLPGGCRFIALTNPDVALDAEPTIMFTLNL